MKFHLMLTFSC